MRPERIDLRAVAPQPWKNGAGLTRELAACPAGADASSFEWRISVADVARDAPFSAFPGIDRHIALLDGPGLELRFDDGRTHRLDRAFEPYAFEGESPLQARVLGGATTDFNVMVRRGHWRAAVRRPPARSDAADAGLLLCWTGALGLDAHGDLAAGQALLWRAGMPSLRIEPAAGTRAVLVRLDRVAA